MDSPIWLNRYTEYAIILAFGLWRIRAEQNPYTRKRLIILVTVVSGFWWLIPWLMPVFEPARSKNSCGYCEFSGTKRVRESSCPQVTVSVTG